MLTAFFRGASGGVRRREALERQESWTLPA